MHARRYEDVAALLTFLAANYKNMYAADIKFEAEDIVTHGFVPPPTNGKQHINVASSTSAKLGSAKSGSAQRAKSHWWSCWGGGGSSMRSRQVIPTEDVGQGCGKCGPVTCN
jgi:hypothetical protein